MRRLVSHRLFRSALVSLLTLTLLLLGYRGQSEADAVQLLVPVGGGYSEVSLEGFSLNVIQHAHGSTVDILVVPSAYGGNQPENNDNLKLAQQRTQDIESACNAMVGSYPFPGGCKATLVLLFDRSEALDPSNSALFNDPNTDGAFILGGDQTIAMQVLAGTPAESAMQGAFNRGVVFGGTSAGDAVLSHSMIAGDTMSIGDSAVYGLERGAVEVWWTNGSNPLQRGLIFGSNRSIFDQHFYQRGRFGRLLNVIAQSDEQFGGASPLGVGVDYRTGVADVNDSTLSSPFGASSVTLVDYETAHGTHTWVGPNQTLSARNIVTHLMAPGDGYTYDIGSRLPMRGNQPLVLHAPSGWTSQVLHAPGPGALILGGDVSTSFAGGAMADFVNRARATGSNRIVVVTAGYSNANTAQSAANNYASGLNQAGWSGSSYKVDTIAYGSPAWSKLDLHRFDGAAGVLFAGGDQSALAGPLADTTFTGLVRYALGSAPVVMTDRAMTAAMGAWYVANPEPTDKTLQDSAIASFQVSNAQVLPGLGILPGAAFEPRLTLDQRWGRLFGLSAAHPDTIVFGVRESTAMTLDGSGAHVIGDRSVVAVDGRASTFGTGSNGALSAYNLLLDVFAPGDQVVASR